MTPSVRFPRALWDSVRAEIEKWAPSETSIFALAKQLGTPDDTVWLVNRLLVLADDEALRSEYQTQPRDRFLWPFYAALKQGGLHEAGGVVAALHSHPFAENGAPRLSPTDWRGIAEDLRVYEREFPQAAFLRLVLNRSLTGFEGFFLKPGAEPVPISEVSVVGPGGFQRIGSATTHEPSTDRDRYSRMLLIPGFDLARVASMRVGLVGLGGLGAKLLQEILSLGIGRDEVLLCCDPDRLELSNLSRMPYARESDVGSPKVDIAVRYVRDYDAHRCVEPLEMSCADATAQEALATADVVLACVDNELARYALNHLASTCLVPLFDFSAGVTVDDIGGTRICAPTGTVRRYVPGESPCLLCNGGLDFADITNEIARLTATGQEKEMLQRAGYLKDLLAEGAPEPSVGHLNSVVAGLGMALVLEWALGAAPACDAVHLDLAAMALFKEQAQQEPTCRFCGDPPAGGGSELASGEVFDLEAFASDRDAEQPPAPAFAPPMRRG